ncbi:hypothetical protein TNCV_3311761 [Trichonephila clavipes]|nr:hypothetical protein TNCV_3311761 [Trichonephila clavipes]
MPIQYTRPLGAEVHEQMSRSGGRSETRSPVFKSPSKLGAHLSTHCSRNERFSRPNCKLTSLNFVNECV